LEKSGPFNFSYDQDDSVKQIEKMISEIYRKEAEYFRRIESVRSNLGISSENELDEAFRKISSPETGLVNFKW